MAANPGGSGGRFPNLRLAIQPCRNPLDDDSRNPKHVRKVIKLKSLIAPTGYCPGTDNPIVLVQVAKVGTLLKFMNTIWFGKILKNALQAIAVTAVLAGSGWGQQTVAMNQPETVGFGYPAPETSTSASGMMMSSSQALPEAPSHHKFWDRENRVLFAATAAGSAADFAVTYSNLQNGGKELNPVTRIFSGSTAGLAANFVGQTGGVIGLSYFFHQTGHHKLERLTPLLNFGASAVAVGYGLAHR
jgi:hypothetical protein